MTDPAAPIPLSTLSESESTVTTARLLHPDTTSTFTLPGLANNPVPSYDIVPTNGTAVMQSSSMNIAGATPKDNVATNAATDLKPPIAPDESSTADQAIYELVPTQNIRPRTSALTTNLMSVFKLNELATSVARFDPRSGEKINKMRKSYEGHLKSISLAGKNKSVKHQDALVRTPSLMGLVEMAAWPEEEWQNQKVHGKSVQRGLSELARLKVEDAVRLQVGPVPDGLKWEDILGIDRPAALAPMAITTTISTKPPADSLGATPRLDSGDHGRSRRMSKKRRYDDRSFEGYGEGFVDDEADLDGGYTSGETFTSRASLGSRGDKKRRKMKDPTAPYR